MRKSMVVKKFFGNTGINITEKTNNEEVIPHTITLLPPNFTDFLQSDPNKLNLDSSVKWNILHCTSVHKISSVVKSRRTFWVFFEIKGLQYGMRATNYNLFNQRETVFSWDWLSCFLTKCTRSRRWCIETIFWRHLQNHPICPFGSHRGPSSSRFWFKCLVSFKATDYTINDAFWPSYDASNFRIRFAFFMMW